MTTALKLGGLIMKANESSLRSWIPVADGSDFPIQNLPFGICRADGIWAGVAIGDSVINLAALQEEGYFLKIKLPAGVFAKPTLNEFFGLGRGTITEVRNRVSEILTLGNDELRRRGEILDRIIVPRSKVEMLLPVAIPNYTDFYSSEEHAFNVGSMFRDPKNALLPNWKHLPVAYHGRASSIVVSGTDVRRPRGQIKMPDSEVPVFSPTRKLDFELEVAFISCRSTEVGTPISAADAEDSIAGFVLFNDWSARDIQQWEYVPLGPFLAKNFASTISPWVVTLDALESFRSAGPKQDPPVLPYLRTSGERNFDVMLEVLLQPEGAEPTTVSRSNFKYLYWNVNQQLAHHTVNGCNIQVGDMFASGTISGPSAGSFGSMLELSWNGQKGLSMPDGSRRFFLEDGDTVIMRGHAQKNGVRIGFGECRGKILPALTTK